MQWSAPVLNSRGERRWQQPPTCPFAGMNQEIGGEGGIRTHLPLTRQDAFEAPPLRPLRYLAAMRAGSGMPPEPRGRVRRNPNYTRDLIAHASWHRVVDSRASQARPN